MIVLSTPRIESLTTTWTPRLTVHVLADGKFRFTNATENRSLIPFCLGPDLDGVMSECGVAIFAGIVETATLHLDSDDVS